MAAHEPAVLSVGTDVSAKYRGAFCEAKVRKVVKNVKCKVILKEAQTSLIVTDEFIKGPLKVGLTAEVTHPDTGEVLDAVINKLTDQSIYTVVFDDGDVATLKRTQLCLKGEKHFIESETLDNLPLSHPEHFGTPVLQSKSRKRTAKMGSPEYGSIYMSQEDTESDQSSSEDSSPRRAMYRGRGQEFVGKVMCVDLGDKKKTLLTPVIVCLPDAHSTELRTKEHMLVRSFRDGRFLSILKKELKEFTREIAIKNEDKNLKTAMEKALLYFDNRELPSQWKREELLGSDDENLSDDDDTSDDEPSEEKDRFVAQLYKFMDDRGTPINKAPSIGSRDLNLYKLFKVVQNIGGYNRVTNQMKWRLVYSKMVLPESNTASHQIKNAYKKYLHAFEDFYRKLGSSMGTISRPGRVRQNSGRSILSFRSRDKGSPKSPRVVKSAEKAVDEKLKVKSDEIKVKLDESRSDEELDVLSKEGSDSEVTKRPVSRRILRDDLREKTEEKREEARVKKEEKEESHEEDDKKPLRKDRNDDRAISKKEEMKVERETRQQKDKEMKQEAKLEREKQKRKEKEKEKDDVGQEDENESKQELKPDQKRVTRRKRIEIEFEKKDFDKEKEKKDVKSKSDEVRLKKDQKKDEKPEDKKEDAKAKEDKKQLPAKEEKKTPKEDKKTPAKEEKKTPAKEEKKIPAKEEKKIPVKEEKKIPVKEEKKTPVKEEKKTPGKEEKKAATKEDKRQPSKEEKKAVSKDSKKPQSKEDKKIVTKEEKTGPMKEEKKAVSLKEEKKVAVKEDKKVAVKDDKKPVVKEEVKRGPVKDEKKVPVKDEKKIPIKETKPKEKLMTSDENLPSDNKVDDDKEKDLPKMDRNEHSQGTKLKVRYGRGKNQKIYEAKVLEVRKEGSHKTYLVHYAGWNNRHDEWIRHERIQSVISRPDTTKKGKKLLAAQMLKDGSILKVVTETKESLLKKRGRPGSTSGQTRLSCDFRSPNQKNKSLSLDGLKSRSTRSNSIDLTVSEGLPPKLRKTRQSSGMTESDTCSHASGDSSELSDGESEEKIVVVLEEQDQSKSDLDMKDTEQDTSLEDEGQDDDHDTSMEEKSDLGLSREEDEDTEEGGILEESLECNEEMIGPEEELDDLVDVDVKDVKQDEMVPSMCKIASSKDKVSDEALSPPKLDIIDNELPPTKEDILGKPVLSQNDYFNDKETAPKLVAENIFKEIPIKTLAEKKQGSERIDLVAEKPMNVISVVENKILLASDSTESMNVPIPEIRKEEAPLQVLSVLAVSPTKSESDIIKKEPEKRGRKKKEAGVVKKGKQAEIPLARSPVPAVSPPMDARMQAAMDLYDFTNFEDNDDIVLREKKPEFGPKWLAESKEKKLDILENVESEKKKVKKKVKKKTEDSVEGKKDTEDEVKLVIEEKKELDERKDDAEVKKDIPVKEGLKGAKFPKVERVIKLKETKKTKDIKDIDVKSDVNEALREKIEKRTRSRSQSPADFSHKVLKSDSFSFSPKPCTSSNTPVDLNKYQVSPGILDSTPEQTVSNIVLDNTPPTTPEHEGADGDNVPLSKVTAVLESEEHVAMERDSKQGSESPQAGSASGSSIEGNESSSVVPSSESSNDVEVLLSLGKRKRESTDQIQNKKKKRSLSKSKSDKHKHKNSHGSDSDEMVNLKLPNPAQPVVSDPSVPVKVPELNHIPRSPRPPKYNFNIEEGARLEGDGRIRFLMEKMQDIRKIYISLKAEVASIDKKRKRAKRKERENSQSSQIELESS
ncbi:AT-rich interactive domain-containing protein 4B-like isoform X2 [Gigantopelta aegis]|uniref:AT-rich interactive domain-containing protein 4B-like isoform X2 n=1 Tax=Gigantopelta aegis TaxID=1735272 RepID=UPI001B88A5A7|nr:AT-rich interactive domain-containing protein 4B-like isoform X2 [Gigantopelta aegis]